MLVQRNTDVDSDIDVGLEFHTPIIRADSQSLGVDLEGKAAEAVDSEWRIRIFI